MLEGPMRRISLLISAVFRSACADRQIDRPTSLHGDVYEQPDEEDIPTHWLPPFGRRVVQPQAESNVAAKTEAQGKDDPFPGDGFFARLCHVFPLQELVSFVKKGCSVLEWCGEHSLFGKAITCVAATTLLEQGRRSEEHTSELQSRLHLVCRLLLEKKKPQLRRPV